MVNPADSAFTPNPIVDGTLPSGEFVMICDESGAIIELTQAAADFIGRYGEDPLDSNVAWFAPHSQAETPLKQGKPKAQKHNRPMNDAPVTLSGRLPDGTDVDFAAVLIRVLSRGGPRYAVVSRAPASLSTPTDRRPLPQPIEFMLARVLAQSVEADLTQASHDIHDGVSQLMSNAVQILQAVDIEKRLEARDRDRISRVLLLLREGIAVARGISRELMPASLERVGLAKTLKFELENLALVGVTNSFEFHAPEPRPRQVDIALYRIAAEALLNVKKHAQAKSVVLRVQSKGPRLAMTIFDDGSGFETPPPLHPYDGTQSHLGLLSMHARALLIGGTFGLETSPGKGTLITVELPNERRSPAKGRTS